MYWMISRIAALSSMVLFVGTALFSQTVETKDSNEDRLRDAIKRHQLLRSLYEYQIQTYSLFHDQTFILLYLHGDRTEVIGTFNKPPRMLDAAVQSRYEPQFNRFKARIGKLDGLSEEQKSLLHESVSQVGISIEAGYEMADFLRADDLGAATQKFHDVSLPAFRNAWRSTYTVISELERAFPLR